jgi:hypothetical protein
MNESIITKGKATILAHLEHLKAHGADEYLDTALQVLAETGTDENKAAMREFLLKNDPAACPSGGCPGSSERILERDTPETVPGPEQVSSELTQWPIQFHLINPSSSAFRGADLLFAADCTAFSLGSFHPQMLRGKKLVIACPKLDQGQEIYRDKLVRLIEESGIYSLHVVIMEVPCCGGLTALAKSAQERAGRKIPLKRTVISVSGEILSEDRLL